MTQDIAKKNALLMLCAMVITSTALAQSRQATVKLSDLTASPVLQLTDIQNKKDSGKDTTDSQALTMSQLVRQGLSSSPQLRQSQAQVAAARSARKSAGADLLPSFSLRFASGPETSRTSGQAADNHRQQVSTIRLTHPLYNANLTHELHSSRDLESAATLRLQAANDNMVLTVARATIDLSAAHLVLDFSNIQLAQLQNILDFQETRTQAGAASGSDLERARSRVYNARQTRLEQQASYRNAFNELRRLTQLNPSAIRLPEMADFPTLDIEQNALKELALQRNPELMAAALELQAHQSRLKGHWARYQPQIGLSLEYDDSRNVRGVNGPSKDVRALIVATWALSLGGKEKHMAEQALAELHQKEAQIEDEKQRLLQALDSDWTLFESAAIRVETAQLEQEAAAKVISAIEAQLRSGRLGSLIDALDASERFFASRQRLVQAIAQNMKAHAQLLARAGQLGDLQP